MRNPKSIIFLVIFSGILYSGLSLHAENKNIESTKKERNYITRGNKLYEEGKLIEAMKLYEDALKENPASVVGKYNLGLSEIRIGSNPNDTSETAKRMLSSGIQAMEQIANLGKNRIDLASKANYNLGNVAFSSQDYKKAIDYYKRSLRLDPNDENARRNLRIAQLKVQNEDQDQNQDQDQDQDQNQNQDQNKEDNQNQDNQDQQNQDNRDQQDQDTKEDQQQQQNALNAQTAEQILNAIENKENQTRARVAGQNAEKSRQRNRNKRNW